MKYFQIYFLLIFSLLPLFGCEKFKKSTTKIDNKSYINDFVLLQENPNNQTSVKITSPNAIIDPTNNDIEIFESSIEIHNKNGQDFKVKSGNSTLNNLTNTIRVFNNVNISFLNNQDYYITTDSFDWDLNTSFIYINNSLNINFDTSNIIASKGLYNIDSSLLKIDNTEFNRNIYNSNDKEEYQIEIKSDFAKWFKKDNTLVFTSNDKQVETTINFLLTE
ncbi:LPS export ABC transporter periplasmic protein LptC [Prochlorococcus marinus]|uniref:LPS export ABC transporter periplasmic protein LptC n=1 Tax=Prochlorococcus marinus TaxID=1219 RepID=UPI0022B3AE1B|nr:LPS export ABC transporter periplasmic protein LptC [Prochlorococcus marinus]